MDIVNFLVAILVAIGLTGSAALTVLGLHAGARENHAESQSAIRLAVVTGVVLALWAATSIALGAGGAYEATVPPWMPVVFCAGLALLLALSQLPGVRRALSGPGAVRLLTRPHTVRVVGVAFLLLMAAGRLPAVFALPAGLGDIAMGVAASAAARRLEAGNGRRFALIFNLAGIADLVIAMTLGGLTGYGALNVHPANHAINELPLVLIPTVGVPLFLALHILSIRRLTRTGARHFSATTSL